VATPNAKGSARMTRYFHGGPAGFQRNSFLLPPSITRVKSTTDYVGKNKGHRQDRVYISTDINAALLFSCAFKRGQIYEVTPIGEVEADPDCDSEGLSYQCEKARIVRVIKVSKNTMQNARSVLFDAEKPA
jgi:hypothetical protein